MGDLRIFRLDIQLEEWSEGTGWQVVHRQIKTSQETLTDIEAEYHELKELLDNNS